MTPALPTLASLIEPPLEPPVNKPLTRYARHLGQQACAAAVQLKPEQAWGLGLALLTAVALLVALVLTCQAAVAKGAIERSARNLTLAQNAPAPAPRALR